MSKFFENIAVKLILGIALFVVVVYLGLAFWIILADFTRKILPYLILIAVFVMFGAAWGNKGNESEATEA